MRKTLVIMGLTLGLSGCSFVIGRHPDEKYARRYCFPCAELTRKAGIGVLVYPEAQPIWKRLSLGWDYRDWFKRAFSWEE
mgnify:CR=1 FL=1